MFENKLRELCIEITQAEEKMESYRQLLNEEIQFNLKDLYIHVSDTSTLVTAHHLHSFLHEAEIQVDLSLLESLIKGYNNCSSMNLTFIEFSMIFLSKENRLLSKLALERDSHGEIPPYLLNYARKLLQLEIALHSKLIVFRQAFSLNAEKWIKENSVLNQNSETSQFDKSVLEELCEELQINGQTLIQFFSHHHTQSIKKQKMLSLLTLKNCANIQQYLKKRHNKKMHQKKNNEPGKLTDPFIRPEFHDCLNRPKTIENFTYREVKSIEKHLDRVNSRNKHELTEKITRFRKMIEKQLIQTCQAIKEIIVLEKQIEYQRVELCLCTDFYPVLFFESLERDKAGLLIPSSFRDYLQKMGVQIPLQEFYLLFKRYSNRVDGKLKFNEFCEIFDVCNSDYTRIEKNREIQGLQDVELETKKHFLRLIKLVVKNELKVEKVKSKLHRNQINLRDVFSVFDGDQDGYISQLDFRIAWKKFLLMDLPEEEISLFWHRMKANPNGDIMVKYDRFINELMPKANWVGGKSRSKKEGR